MINKYENTQAQVVQEFEQDYRFDTHDGEVIKDRKRIYKAKSKCSRQYFRKWWPPYGEYFEAHQRLGRKISYISLYEYCHIVDKHERQVAEQTQMLEKASELIHQQTVVIEQLEKENEEMKSNIDSQKDDAAV